MSRISPSQTKNEKKYWDSLQLYNEPSVKLDENTLVKSWEVQNVVMLDEDLKSPDLDVVVDIVAAARPSKKCITLSAIDFAKIKANPALTLE